MFFTFSINLLHADSCVLFRYACSSFLLTPFLNPNCDAQRRYNAAHCRTRNLIERTFGQWKSRFRCLRTPIRFSSRRCCNVILATVLHNYAKQQNEPDVEELDIEDEPAVLNNDLIRINDNHLRQRIVEKYFA